MRIRTLKPEWLTDEKMEALEDSARLLSAGLILLADDPETSHTAAHRVVDTGTVAVDFVRQERGRRG